MFTKQYLEKLLKNHPLIKPRLEVLRLAEEINPNFKNPHIIGGFLRNVIFNVPPRDCDVVFQGNQLNQQGILEAVRNAEKQLGIEPFADWEFENSTATGLSGNFYEDTIGKSSYHTDYLTMIMIDSSGKLFIGQDQVLHDLENHIYDLYFPGVYIWTIHRGNGRSFFSCLIGDLIRAIYLTPILNLTLSSTATFFMDEFDTIFKKLDPDDQKARLDFWQKKTSGGTSYQPVLDKYGVTTLKTKSSAILQ